MLTSPFSQLFAQVALVFIPMVLALCVHEFSHGLMARLLGDKTAQRQGRLTLNPLAHADIIGTFVLPLSILLLHSAAGGLAMNVPLFGWAKPVPFNTAEMTRRISARAATTLVAAAGPLSNLLLALLTGLLLGQIGWIAGDAAASLMLGRFFMVNIGLCVFNLLPIHPLDGYHIALGMLPLPVALNFERFSAQYGMWILGAIIFFAQGVILWPSRQLASLILRATGVY